MLLLPRLGFRSLTPFKTLYCETDTQETNLLCVCTTYSVQQSLFLGLVHRCISISCVYLYSLQASYDLDHALVLAQMHDFRAGILYLYERAGL